MAETNTTTRDYCFACGKSFADGDPVYEDVNEGLIHAACLGPERESYVGADGGPLKPGEPIPDPGTYRSAARHIAMADGCCSAISPCTHQRHDPTTICAACESAALAVGGAHG